MSSGGRVLVVGSWLAIAVLVVMGCEPAQTPVPQKSGHESAQTSATSPPSSTSSPTASELLHRGRLQSYASRDGVETLTIWELCDTGCHVFWVLSGATPAPVIGDAGSGAVPAVMASRPGYVVAAFGRRAFVVRPDGTRRGLEPATAPGRVDADTVILPPRRGELTAVDADSATTWQLPGRSADASTYATAVSGGTVWALPQSGRGGLAVLRFRDGRWDSLPMSGLYPPDSVQQGIAAAGWPRTRIAVVTTHGNAETPPAIVLVSTDAGHTWRRLVEDGKPFAFGDSMAIAGDTLFLSGAGGRVWRTTGPDWTGVEPVPGLRGVVGLQPAGKRVIGWRWRANELVSIDRPGRFDLIRLLT